MTSFFEPWINYSSFPRNWKVSKSQGTINHRSHYWTCGPVDLWTLWTLWTCGPVDSVDLWTLWTCGLCGLCGPVDSVDSVDSVDLWTLWTLWTCGPVDLWTCGPVDLWTLWTCVLCGPLYLRQRTDPRTQLLLSFLFCLVYYLLKLFL